LEAWNLRNFSHGAGLRVGEMTQIKAEDVDFRKGYLHVQATNAKFKKPRTVVLLPQVAEVLQKQLAGRSKGWLFPSYREEHISSRQVQNILDGIASRAGLQEVKRKDKAGKDRHRVHPHMLSTVLPSGASIVACQWEISRTSLGMCLWLQQASTSRPARTTGERLICGQGCRISLQERRLEN
jgi:site-specific recombinase XerD